MLVGNKVDLGNRRQVCADEALTKAQECNIEFIQSSAKFNINVKEAFMTLVLKTFQDTPIEEFSRKRSSKRGRGNGNNKNENGTLSPRDFSASIKRKSNGRTKLVLRKNSEGDSEEDDMDARCVLM